MRSFLFIALLWLLAGAISGAQAQTAWKPVQGNIMSRWAAKIDPDNVMPEYPRPQLVRERWQNLNGLWDYAILPREIQAAPAEFQGKILVPFPIQSALSGVKKSVASNDRLWYRRSFTVPAAWGGQRVMLNFGAVDWQSTVWVNGKQVGEHRGAHDAFAFDITAALKKEGAQELVLVTYVPPSGAPRGKGSLGTRNSIWQPVWLEPLPPVAIDSLKITPDIDAGTVRLEVKTNDSNFAGAPPTYRVEVLDAGKPVATGSAAVSQPLVLTLKNAKLWGPDHPFLYDLKVTLLREGKNLDAVGSYFGMRKIALQKDGQGINRLFLNNKPLFHFGPLDQGVWPDGLCTAPGDEALRYDLEATLKIGCNMVRKHMKVEPARWYYWTDKLGLLVWQDMPCSKRIPADQNVKSPSDEIFEREYRRMIETHYNHPSIVMWVPFNERWGQYNTERIAAWTRQFDPTRLVDSVSGWDDKGAGDVYDKHAYPGPAMWPLEEKRASVLGEFGGLGLAIPGHSWNARRLWGYETKTDIPALTKRYGEVMEKLKPMIAKGLAAAVYTQTTDVEGEVNGFMTFDRALIKMELEPLAKLNRSLYEIKSKAAR